MQQQSPFDTKRLIAFFAISLLVAMGWSALFARRAPPRSEAAPTPTAAAQRPAADGANAGHAVAPAASDVVGVASEAVSAASLERHEARTDRAVVEVTNRGGRVTSWQLVEHGEYGDPRLPLDIVKRVVTVEGEPPPRVADDAPLLPLQVVTGDPALDATLAAALHDVAIERGKAATRILMRWSDGAGLAVEKVLELDAHSYLARVEARLSVGGRLVPFRLAWGPGIATHASKGTTGPYFKRGEVAYRTGGKVRTASKPEKAHDLDASPVAWAALRDSFFAVAFVPRMDGPTHGGSESAGFHVGGSMPPRADGKERKGAEWAEWLTLEAPFSPERDRMGLYVGPIDRRILPEADAALNPSPRLSALAHVGILEPIAAVMHRIMVWFHDRTGSWGVAILLLTVVIRAALFPFTHASLKKMRALQTQMTVMKPKIDQLRERYRRLPRTLDNRQREQQELLAIYQAAGVSPFASAGGCLPILLSMPFFFALFQLLPRAAEFRHQPFMFWPDLSSADPWYVLPLLMGVTMYVSSRSSVASNAALDPVNRNMMLYLFPVMFTWFCIGAPLGLVVYWTTSNLIQIGQQVLLNRTQPATGAIEAPAPKPTKATGRRPARSRNS